MYHIWNSVPDGGFTAHPFLSLPGSAAGNSTFPFVLTETWEPSLPPLPLSYLTSIVRLKARGSEAGASTACWVSSYLCGRRQNMFCLKEAYKLARQKMVGLGHRKGVKRAERTESTGAEAGGLVWGWPGGRSGWRQPHEGRRERSVESCQLLLGPTSLHWAAQLTLQACCGLSPIPKTCVQPFCSHPDSCPLLTWPPLASWFLNLCVWLWTLAVVVHPSQLPPNTVHGPVLVNETRNANREMRKVRTMWHHISRITFLPVCYWVPGTWLDLTNVSAVWKALASSLSYVVSTEIMLGLSQEERPQTGRQFL